MNTVIKSPHEVAYLAYAKSKKASDLIRKKSLHFYNEMRAKDGFKTALGRMFKYTSSTHRDTSISSLFTRSTGLAYIVANQIQIESAEQIRVFQKTVQELNESFARKADIKKLPVILSPTLSNNFVIANDPTYVSDHGAELLEIRLNVALTEAHAKASGEFIGPVTQETSAQLDALHNKDISFEEFQENLLLKRGFVETKLKDDTKTEFGFAVSADYLRHIDSIFGQSTGSTKHPIPTFSNKTEITTGTSLERGNHDWVPKLIHVEP